MRNSTQLGMSLGKMLSGSFDNTAYERGQANGADLQYKQAATQKALIEAAAKQQEIDNSSDGGLIKSLLSGIGANSEAGNADFMASMQGNLKPLAGAPTPQQAAGGATAIPVPSYVDKFPELQQKFAGLKQMLALGDKSLPNLSKSIQGDQRNAITSGLNADNAADIGLQVSALEGNVNPLEMQKASITRALTQSGNPQDLKEALLLSQGHGAYNNMGSDGTFNTLTGESTINPLAVKPQADQWTYDEKNGIRVNKATGLGEPIMIGGKAMQPKNEREVKLDKGEEMLPNGDIRAVKGSNLYIKQSKDHGKEIENLNGLNLSTKNAITKIDKILDPDNEGAFNSNFGGYNASISNKFPGAQDTRNTIEALKSDLKMAGLNTIRAGGSIGAMTEKEWPIVEGMISRISPTLSEDEAKGEFQKIKAYLQNIESKANDTYDEVWGNTQYYKPRSGGKTQQPKAASAEDSAAISWARANPKDPRSAQILQRNGM